MPGAIDIHDVGDGRYPRIRFLRKDGADEVLQLLAQYIVAQGLPGLPTPHLPGSNGGGLPGLPIPQIPGTGSGSGSNNNGNGSNGHGSTGHGSTDKDGSNSGFDLELVQSVKDAVKIPVIASSGAGVPEHFGEVFEKTTTDAALGAGMVSAEWAVENFADEADQTVVPQGRVHRQAGQRLSSAEGIVGQAI